MTPSAASKYQISVCVFDVLTFWDLFYAGQAFAYVRCLPCWKRHLPHAFKVPVLPKDITLRLKRDCTSTQIIWPVNTDLFIFYSHLFILIWIIELDYPVSVPSNLRISSTQQLKYVPIGIVSACRRLATQPHPHQATPQLRGWTQLLSRTVLTTAYLHHIHVCRITSGYVFVGHNNALRHILVRAEFRNESPSLLSGVVIMVVYRLIGYFYMDKKKNLL